MRQYFRLFALCLGVCGTVAAQAPTPTVLSGFTLATDRLRREVVLFGGERAGVASGETWAWQGAFWVPRPTVSGPPARSGHAMVFDEARGEIILFGGLNPSPNGTDGILYDDTWVWNGATWTQRFPATRPPARVRHSLVYDAARREVVLHGGGITRSGTTVYTDTWVWNGTTWTQRISPQTPPAALTAMMAYDPLRRETIWYTGVDRGQWVFETWSWNGTAWQRRSAAGSPTMDTPMQMGFDRQTNSILLRAQGDPGITQTFQWTGSTWQGLGSGLSEAVGGLRGAMATFLDDTARLVVFGPDFSNFYLWSGISWVQHTVAPPPADCGPNREGAAMTFDTLRNQLVRFGGGRPTPPRPRSAMTRGSASKAPGSAARRH